MKQVEVSFDEEEIKKISNKMKAVEFTRLMDKRFKNLAILFKNPYVLHIEGGVSFVDNNPEGNVKSEGYTLINGSIENIALGLLSACIRDERVRKCVTSVCDALKFMENKELRDEPEIS